ncbi:MAG: potassium channel protein [Desulfovibrio sp.]|nr:MAG: potassium channel protein [Desulfovibrio sp.]
MKVPQVRLRYSRMRNRLGAFLPIVMGTIFIIFVFITAIVGYMYLEGWNFFDSFYMAVITLSTVGYSETHELSKMGRMFTSGLIFFGVGGFMFMAGSVAQLLVEGKLQEVLGRRRMQHNIDKFHGHSIICGYGRIGKVVAQEILAEGNQVVVLESNPEMALELEEEGINFIIGDATDDDVLLKAGIERAGYLIAALSNEAANVYVVLTARQLRPNLYIVSRADNQNHINRLERAGADRAIMPHFIGGMRMAQTVLRPSVISFVELAVRGSVDLQLEEHTISETSSLVGKDLIKSEIRPRFNIIIIGIKDNEGETVFNPPPNHVLKPGDTLLCVGARDNQKQLQEIL